MKVDPLDGKKLIVGRALGSRSMVVAEEDIKVRADDAPTTCSGLFSSLSYPIFPPLPLSAPVGNLTACATAVHSPAQE